MSGTSLDGIDLAFCSFSRPDNELRYEVLHTKAINYSEEWKTTLQQLPFASAKEFIATDHRYGKYIGQLIDQFCNEINKRPDAIASHGHTIFHEPTLGYTSQIGNPNAIYAQCEIPVIADFRSLDVAFGGTGAPLVPIGDQLLFPGYICVNLGGIANLSYMEHDVTAFDVSPFNLLLNHIANQNGTTYDENGRLSATGEVNKNLLSALEKTSYYKESHPKSLDKTWVEQHFFPLIAESRCNLADKQRTIIQHLVIRLDKELKKAQEKRRQPVLITGGGAHNIFFIEQLKARATYEIIVPDTKTVDFKEALIFAFLGYRKLTHQYNILAKVTGASKNVIGGVMIDGGF